MWASSDSELLRCYAENHSEDAFAALVTRHVNLVYSVALRRAGNPDQAEEITQAVFILLARKPVRLRHDNALASWLFETTRLTAANFLRSEMRRRLREEAARSKLAMNDPADENWRAIAPLLDDAVARLREKDRRAILLRFYEGKSLREIGQLLGVSEEAAKKRTNRALETLRVYFGRRGVGASAAVLTNTLADYAVQAAPATLAKSAVGAALSQGGAAGLSTLALVEGALKIMAWTKAQTTVATTLIVGLAAVTILQHHAQVKLREADDLLRQQMAQAQADNERLTRKPAPLLPAPTIASPVLATATSSPLSTALTNLYARLYERLRDTPVKLTPEQSQAYLNSAGTNATSLLAAFRTSGDVGLLHKAMQDYPGDPYVAFEAAFDSTLSSDERRQWLEAFEKSAPDNGLANYLAAQEYFKAGDPDEAVQEVEAAAGKGFDDYTVKRAVDDDEAFLAAGFSSADAKVLATSQLLLPQLAQMKDLGINLVQAAEGYRQAGDAASAQLVLQIADELGQRYSTSTPGEPEISQLVGIRIELSALQNMDPNAAYGDTGQTIQARIDQLTAQRDSTRQLGEQASQLFPTLSDQDWITYKDRWLLFGEADAQQWVVNKYGQK